MLNALLAEYQPELERKEGKLDTDPHFWMPMTLPRASYIYLMSEKQVPETTSGPHYDRISAMVEKYNLGGSNTSTNTTNAEAVAKGITGLFGPCDVGNDIYWWDYGQLKYYQKNALLVNAK